MLGLKLREEFLGKLLKGTAIELANDSKTGATQVGAQSFLGITYPTHDLVKAIEAVGPAQGRPVAVIGERGAGKSHLMAALYHAVSDPSSTRHWLEHWAKAINAPELATIKLRSGMQVIGDSLHRQRYKYLWDVLLENHPHGVFIRGKWLGAGAGATDIMPHALVIELLEKQPVMLLLDEFQTWFDGLANTDQQPTKNWAFTFIQILSEIAKERPDLLVLVISVRNGSSDAYQQVHRVNPVAIDFMAGGNPQKVQEDRRRMLLHRLFENRLNMNWPTVLELVKPHVDEHFRLLAVPPADQERRRREFGVSWPFAPHLLRLLEEQVLIATDAQETRDLIRILANLYKSRGEKVPVLTAADFSLADDSSGIGALLDSVSNTEHRGLRGKAQQNIIAVRDAVPDVDTALPHLDELMASLWLRSIAVGNNAGGEAAMLQSDITRGAPLDDNAFAVELGTIVENSFNIHREAHRLVFRSEENPQAKLMAHARNDRLFADGRDQQHLAKEVRYVLSGEVGSALVIALPPQWTTEPWINAEGAELPAQWTDLRPPVVVLPEVPEPLGPVIGRWLHDHLQSRRNTVRFVLPSPGKGNAYLDRELLILARATLTAGEWAAQSGEYRKLQSRYQTELRDLLKKRFDRFAVLRTWAFAQPETCTLNIEPLKKQGAQIPEAIQETLLNDVFVPEDFEAAVLAAATANDAVGKLFREMQEPRPNGEECIPWLGETVVKEKLLRLCAAGKVALNVRGTEQLQAQPGESAEAAWLRMRARLPFSGKQLDEVKLMEPAAMPGTGGAAPSPAPAPAPNPAPGPGPSPQPGPSPAPEKPPIPPLFGGGSPEPSPPPPPAPKPLVTLENDITSTLNQLHQLTDNWAIKSKAALTSITLTIPAASLEQLQDILKKMPTDLKVGLSLQKEEE